MSSSRSASGSNNLECSICLQPFEESGPKEPKITPCGHTFCAGCIGAWPQSLCPLCRAPFPATTPSSSFPANFTVKSLLQDYAAMKRALARFQDFEIDPSMLVVSSELLGCGRFGQVYKGSFSGLPVAVKFVHDMTPAAQEQVKREIEVLRCAQHPNVVQLIGRCDKHLPGASSGPTHSAIVMELVDGSNLFQLVHNPEAYLGLSEDEKFQIALQVAHGMDHLHGKRILHRDLKTANILLDKHRNAKISDFGLSRIHESMSTLTGGLGTIAYSAPEASEQGAYTNKADVYSYGMVLFELFTGQAPFSGMTPMQVMRALLSETRPKLPRDMKPGVTQLITACWQQNPEARPSFHDILTQFLPSARDLVLPPKPIVIIVHPSTLPSFFQSPVHDLLLPVPSATEDLHALLTSAVSTIHGADPRTLTIILRKNALAGGVQLTDALLPPFSTVVAEVQIQRGRLKTMMVRDLIGQTTSIQFSGTEKIRELKSQIAAKQGTPPDQQRLIFGARQLEDEWTANDYGITHESTVFLVLRLCGNGHDGTPAYRDFFPQKKTGNRFTAIWIEFAENWAGAQGVLPTSVNTDNVLTVRVGDSTIAGLTTWDRASNRAIFIPSAPLPVGATVTVLVDNHSVQNDKGYMSMNDRWTFEIDRNPIIINATCAGETLYVGLTRKEDNEHTELLRNVAAAFRTTPANIASVTLQKGSRLFPITSVQDAAYLESGDTVVVVMRS